MTFDIMAGLDVANMDEKTIEVLKVMGKSIEQAMTGYMADTMTKEQFNSAISEQLKQMDNSAELSAVKSQLQETQQTLLRIKGAMEKGEDGVVRVKSIEEQVAEQLNDFITTEKKGAKVVDLRGACKSGAGFKKTINLVLDKKEVGTIMSGGAPHFGNAVDTAISVEPRANTILRQYSNVAAIGSRSLTYAQLINVEGDAAWVAEGGEKPMMDGELEEVTINAAKVALGAKLTEETLTDLPQLVAEIRAEIINKIGLKEEQGILTGNGQNGTIKGVASNLPAFNLTDVKIATPSIVDAIVAAYTQIISNSNQSYVPNVVMINPLDWANMAREKDSTGRPLNENLAAILPTGLNVVVSTAVAKGKLLIGDFNYLNIRDYVMLTITFGWENDDFTKNLVTMIGEKRLMAYIKNQYKTAFVYDTIANIKTAITRS